MKKLVFILTLFIFGCDLRQKIVDIPDNVGDFIATRYPALLADPNSEIYEYASVLDYGMPESDTSLYGTVQNEQLEYGDVNDYTNYSDKSDYTNNYNADWYNKPTTQTISDVEKDYGTLVVAEKKSFVLNKSEVVVKKGDTAYSIAKKYNMPVIRLAALNNIKPPYELKVGQKLKVEKAEIVTATTEITKSYPKKSNAQIIAASPVIKSNADIKLPKLSARSSNKFSWPVIGTVISDFGPKSNGLNNDGINIKANTGTVVKASDNGVVAYAGNELKGMGNLLIVQHSGGFMTVYAHLDSFVVKRGDRVLVGQKIGTVGKTGRVDEPQLHFEIRKGSKAFDPKKQLR